MLDCGHSYQEGLFGRYNINARQEVLYQGLEALSG